MLNAISALLVLMLLVGLMKTPPILFVVGVHMQPLTPTDLSIIRRLFPVIRRFLDMPTCAIMVRTGEVTMLDPVLLPVPVVLVVMPRKFVLCNGRAGCPVLWVWVELATPLMTLSGMASPMWWPPTLTMNALDPDPLGVVGVVVFGVVVKEVGRLEVVEVGAWPRHACLSYPADMVNGRLRLVAKLLPWKTLPNSGTGAGMFLTMSLLSMWCIWVMVLRWPRVAMTIPFTTELNPGETALFRLILALTCMLGLVGYRTPLNALELGARPAVGLLSATCSLKSRLCGLGVWASLLLVVTPSRLCIRLRLSILLEMARLIRRCGPILRKHIPLPGAITNL